MLADQDAGWSGRLFDTGRDKPVSKLVHNQITLFMTIAAPTANFFQCPSAPAAEAKATVNGAQAFAGAFDRFGRQWGVLTSRLKARP